jgi:hypothetical protein
MQKISTTLVALVLLAALGFGLRNFLPSSDSKPSELTKEEYDIVETELLETARTRDPRAAMEKLRKKSQENEAVQRSCHTFGHALGHAAYDKYGDFGEALVYQSEFCNSAYLHGVIEDHFAKSSNVFAEMASICGAYPKGKFGSAQCYHGVGHGVMFYTNNDLPKSTEFCAVYEDLFARSNCLMGVYMENFSSDKELHDSLYVKADDPFYPCQEQTLENRQVCYLWAPTYYLSLHKNEYSEALAWCKEATPLYQSICVLGVGGQAMRENIGHPELVESVCKSGEPSQVAPCIAGMTHIYVSHFGALEPALKMCERLEEANKVICNTTIKGLESLFR